MIPARVTRRLQVQKEQHIVGCEPAPSDGPDRGGAGSHRISARPAYETRPGWCLAWRWRPLARVRDVRVVCRWRLEWNVPDQSRQGGLVDVTEGFYSPPTGIHSAAETADSPSRSRTLTGAPLVLSSSKRIIIRCLSLRRSSFLTEQDRGGDLRGSETRSSRRPRDTRRLPPQKLPQTGPSLPPANR